MGWYKTSGVVHGRIVYGAKDVKPCDLTATVNDAVAYTDVGKGREQDAVSFVQWQVIAPA